MNTDGKTTILVEVDRSLISSAMSLEDHVNGTVSNNFGFDLDFKENCDLDGGIIIKAQIATSNIPPLASMQQHHKGNLFNEIENALTELTENRLGDLNNGRNGTMTAFEIDRLIESGLNADSSEDSLLTTAVLEVIFDAVTGVNFMKRA